MGIPVTGRFHAACFSAVVCVLLFVAAGATNAQYPDRPIRFLVPYAPGGSSDAIGRIIGQKLGDALGQSLVIDNRAGAAGMIGRDLAAKAPASSEQGSRLRDANVRERGESAVG
jgi:tripartite-type tricarboxylate transporter receptor subunit TctC